MPTGLEMIESAASNSRGIIVIPVGPNEDMEYVADTIESIAFYTRTNPHILVIDNTGAGRCQPLRERYSRVTILNAEGYSATRGKLYYALSEAFQYAFLRFDFNILLKMDADTLMIGYGPDEDAVRYFEANPSVGLIGSYKIGCDGGVRSFQWPREQLRREISWVGRIRDRDRCDTLRRLVSDAAGYGYEHGENVLGAAYFLSAACIQKLYEAQLLTRTDLYRSRLGEDHILSLLVRAVGMELGDFATADKPLGVKYRGLPFAPEELVIKRKKIISIEPPYWKDMEEGDVRRYFRDIRQKKFRTT